MRTSTSFRNLLLSLTIVSATTTAVAVAVAGAGADTDTAHPPSNLRPDRNQHRETSVYIDTSRRRGHEAQNQLPALELLAQQQEDLSTMDSNLGPVIPGDGKQNPDSNSDSGSGSDLTISDILPKTRAVNIFASLTRDVTLVSGRLQSSSPSDNTTLLAPLNSVMQALPRKPWEDRPGQERAQGQGDEDRAEDNLRRFVMAHVVPVSPWREGEDNKLRTLGGREIWWETRGGGNDGSEKKKVIMPGEVVVEEVAGRVGNGEVWILKGVINY